MSFCCQSSRLWCDSQDLRCQSETLSNGKERQGKGFNHTAWGYNHVTYTHTDTHFIVASEGVMMMALQNQALNERLSVICKSQQGPTGRWLSFLAESGPPLTCLPATSCLLVLLSLPSWHAVRLQGRWEAQEGLWMSEVDRGPTPACTQHRLVSPLPPFLLTPPGSTSSCWITDEQQLMGVDRPSDCLTACGHAKCTDFHMLMLRSGVVRKHATRDCCSEQASREGVCIQPCIQHMHNSVHHPQERQTGHKGREGVRRHAW